jgi:hypothetical protein
MVGCSFPGLSARDQAFLEFLFCCVVVAVVVFLLWVFPFGGFSGFGFVFVLSESFGLQASLVLSQGYMM